MLNIKIFFGSIGSGKSFISSREVSKYKSQGNTIFYISFADPLKRLLNSANIFRYDILPMNYNDRIFVLTNNLHKLLSEFDINKSISEIDYMIRNQEVLKYIFEYLDMNYDKLTVRDKDKFIRKCYVNFSENVCKKIDNYIWVKCINRSIENVKNNIDLCIIDDMRFYDEFTNFYKFHLLKKYNVEFIYIDAYKEIRAKRKNLTIEELEEMEKDPTELESSEILNTLKNNYLNNFKIIENN